MRFKGVQTQSDKVYDDLRTYLPLRTSLSIGRVRKSN